MDKCDGCAFLRFEDRPHGMRAARCGNPAPTGGPIRGFGRTLEVSNIGVIVSVIRPAWCVGERKTLSATSVCTGDSSPIGGAKKERSRQ
jgi:hypothetical protein